MAHLIDLKTYCDSRGNLTVIEQVLPFAIKRIFYIYGVDTSIRGGHRHQRTVQAAICLQGACTVWNDNGTRQDTFVLDRPDKCLILEPQDWHKMYDFTPDAMLMVLASELFDPDDYLYPAY